MFAIIPRLEALVDKLIDEIEPIPLTQSIENSTLSMMAITPELQSITPIHPLTNPMVDEQQEDRCHTIAFVVHRIKRQQLCVAQSIPLDDVEVMEWITTDWIVASILPHHAEPQSFQR